MGKKVSSSGKRLRVDPNWNDPDPKHLKVLYELQEEYRV
jgi:hypothetical protein